LDKIKTLLIVTGMLLLCISLVTSVLVYLENLALQNKVESLTSEVNQLNEQIEAMKYTKMFTFKWYPYAEYVEKEWGATFPMQKIVNGTLIMTVKFKEVSGNLSATIFVNDDDYSENDWLFIALDRDGNDIIGAIGADTDFPAYRLLIDGTYQKTFVDPYGTFAFIKWGYWKDNSYNYTYLIGVGHLYSLMIEKPLGDQVYIQYYDGNIPKDYNIVSVRFHTGIW